MTVQKLSETAGRIGRLLHRVALYVWLLPQNLLGHAKQSRLLGPLYLIVIGLPSILWAGIHGKVAPRKSYYWFYTERWADRLGGVGR